MIVVTPVQEEDASLNSAYGKIVYFIILELVIFEVQ